MLDRLGNLATIVFRLFVRRSWRASRNQKPIHQSVTLVSSIQSVIKRLWRASAENRNRRGIDFFPYLLRSSYTNVWAFVYVSRPPLHQYGFDFCYSRMRIL